MRSWMVVMLLTAIGALLRLHGLFAPLDPEDLTFTCPFLGGSAGTRRSQGLGKNLLREASNHSRHRAQLTLPLP